MSECQYKKCQFNIAFHGGSSCDRKYCSPKACAECKLIMHKCKSYKDKVE